MSNDIVSAPVTILVSDGQMFTRQPADDKREVPEGDRRVIDEAAADILSALTFREKSIIANMDADSLDYLQYAFDRYISDKAPDDEGRGREIMRRLWFVCRETHKIRSVE